MAEIHFKAAKHKSLSCDSYRAIEKHGNTEYDLAQGSDDVIIFYPKENSRIHIDCDKKTGEFKIVFTSKHEPNNL